MKKLFIAVFILMMVSLSAQIGLDARYHTYEEILAVFDSLQTNYPEIVKVEQIGTTLGAVPYQEPIPIWAIKLSNNAAVDEDEPEIMFAGTCHAEEVLGTEITMYMIEQIVEYYYAPPFNIWLDNLEMWFVPTYNPEGMQVVMDGWDITYRKNKRDNNMNGVFDYVAEPGGDIDGVDLNRNYSFNWIHGAPFDQEGDEELYDYYRGPGPFSEGGTQAIRDFAAEHHFLYSINFHSSRTGNFSEKCYHSFNWGGEKPSPDILLAQSIGDNVAALIEKENGAGNYESYPSSGRKGNAHDWFYKEHGTIQLLIEVGTNIIQPEPEIVDDTCVRCSNGAYWLMNRALGYNADAAMLTGHITDSETGEPIVAEVRIEGFHASYFTPRLSDATYGRYWRPLMPGTYDVRVIKEGYAEKLVENVMVNNSLWKIQNIELDPLLEFEISGTIFPENATLILDKGEYFSADTISVTNGEFDFSVFEGEYFLTAFADGFVPQTHNIADRNMDIILSPAVEIFAENWEDGVSNWEISGNWALTSNANSGANAITDSPDEFYQNEDFSYLQIPLNMNGVSDDVALIFWHKYQTEHDFDFCSIEYSLNGDDWNILKQFSGRDMDWHQEIISLSDLVSNNVFVRFALATDDSIDDPGWWIDDIKIVATTGASANPDDLTEQFTFTNYPNPFSNLTTIAFNLSDNVEDVELEIYNLKGQKVQTFTSHQILSSSNQDIIWNAENFASGIYFAKLVVDGKIIETRKMMLIK